MFCKYCGRRIVEIEKPCSYCKKEQGALQATNGYFGILSVTGQKEKPEIAVPQTTKSEEQGKKEEAMKKENEQLKRKLQRYEQAMRIGSYTMILLGAIALAGFIVVGVTQSKLQKNIDNLLTQQEVLEEEFLNYQAGQKNSVESVENLLAQKEEAWQEELAKQQEAQENVTKSYEKQLEALQEEYIEQLQEMEATMLEYHKEEAAEPDVAGADTSNDVEPDTAENSEELLEDTGDRDTEETIEGQDNE